MATDPDAAGAPVGDASAENEEEAPYFVEVWNDYDPSMKFAVIFPVGERQGATSGSVAYYIIGPGRHTGLHSDNAEEIVFVAEGEGEVFSIGKTQRLVPGQFVVFAAGVDHDIYGHGGVDLRLLSFFATTEIISTFQQAIYPPGGTELSSKPPESVPRVIELDPDNLPADFPFSLDELGLAETEEPRELSMTQRLIGMSDPNDPAPEPESEAGEAAGDPAGSGEEPRGD